MRLIGAKHEICRGCQPSELSIGRRASNPSIRQRDGAWGHVCVECRRKPQRGLTTKGSFILFLAGRLLCCVCYRTLFHRSPLPQVESPSTLFPSGSGQVQLISHSFRHGPLRFNQQHFNHLNSNLSRNQHTPQCFRLTTRLMASCVSLRDSTACPAFNASSISTDSTLQGLLYVQMLPLAV